MNNSVNSALNLLGNQQFTAKNQALKTDVMFSASQFASSAVEFSEVSEGKESRSFKDLMTDQANDKREAAKPRREPIEQKENTKPSEPQDKQAQAADKTEPEAKSTSDKATSDDTRSATENGQSDQREGNGNSEPPAQESSEGTESEGVATTAEETSQATTTAATEGESTVAADVAIDPLLVGQATSEPEWVVDAIEGEESSSEGVTRSIMGLSASGGNGLPQQETVAATDEALVDEVVTETQENIELAGVSAGMVNTRGVATNAGGVNPVSSGVASEQAGTSLTSEGYLQSKSTNAGSQGAFSGGADSQSGQPKTPAQMNMAAFNTVNTQVSATDVEGAEANAPKVARIQAAAAAVTSLNDQMSTTRTQQLQRPPVATNVMIPVGQRQWSEAVAEKVAWLSSQNITAAEIKLDPPELGAMNVRIQVTNDQTTVSFTAQNAVVREALEQTAIRLRDMLAEQGLELAEMDVSSQSHEQHERAEEGEAQAGFNGDEELEDEEMEVVAETPITHNGLVDHFV